MLGVGTVSVLLGSCGDEPANARQLANAATTSEGGVCNRIAGAPAELLAEYPVSLEVARRYEMFKTGSDRGTSTLSGTEPISVCWTYVPGGYHISTPPGDTTIYDVQVAIASRRDIVSYVQFSARSAVTVVSPSDDMTAANAK